jgi:hypothetical protein
MFERISYGLSRTLRAALTVFLEMGDLIMSVKESFYTPWAATGDAIPPATVHPANMEFSRTKSFFSAASRRTNRARTSRDAWARQCAKNVLD